MAQHPVNPYEKTCGGDPAWNFLLAAVSYGAPSDRVKNTLATVDDWDAVTSLADRHGVSSLAYQKLMQAQDDIPPAQLAPLRQSLNAMFINLFFLRES